MEFYYNRSGEQFGPYSRTELLEKIRDGEVSPLTMGWHEGLEGWTPLGVIFEDELIESVTPPPSSGQRSYWLLIVFLLGMVSVVLFYRAWNQSGPEAVSPSSPETSNEVAVDSEAKESEHPAAPAAAPASILPREAEAEEVAQPADSTQEVFRLYVNGALVEAVTDVPEASELLINARRIYKTARVDRVRLVASIDLYRKSAELKNTLAMLDLAHVLLEGDSEKRAEAFDFYLSAANLGNPAALRLLSFCISDHEKSVMLLTLSAKAGLYDACLDLVTYYETGILRRTPSSPEEKLIWQNFQMNTPSQDVIFDPEKKDFLLALQWMIVAKHLQPTAQNEKRVEFMQRYLNPEAIAKANEKAQEIIRECHLIGREAFEKRIAEFSCFYVYNAYDLDVTPSFVERKAVESEKPSEQATAGNSTNAVPSESPRRNPNAKQPAPQKEKSLIGTVKLSGWASSTSSTRGGGRRAIQELLDILGSRTQPSKIVECWTPANIYKEVTYLMPLKEAVQALKLQRIPFKVKLATPGLPQGLHYYSFDGFFDGFNKLYLVTDLADQVVSVQLVNEVPKHGSGMWFDNSIYIYNFINSRYRASTDLSIWRQVYWADEGFMMANQTDHGIQSFQPNGMQPFVLSDSSGTSQRYDPFEADHQRVLVVDLQLTNRKLPKPILEEVRWFIPEHLVGIILGVHREPPESPIPKEINR